MVVFMFYKLNGTTIGYKTYEFTFVIMFLVEGYFDKDISLCDLIDWMSKEFLFYLILFYPSF